MLKKVLILVGALVVAGGATGGALYYFYPVRVSVFAGLTRNFFLSWSAPPGTVSTETNPAGQSAAATVPVPAAQAPPPEPAGADWPGYNRTLTSDRFSPLRQINTENVGKLKVLCTYDVGQFAAFESGMIMVDNALIGTTEFDIFSLDPATCAENWRTHEDYPPSILPANRGAAYADGMLFRGTQDGRVLAYDFKTGKRLWETTIADVKRGESVPSAPIAWEGMVFVGNAGGDYKGGKGRMYALDAKTGKIVWEFFLVPKAEDETARGRWAPRRSTCRPGRTRPAYRSAAEGPGRRTRSTRRPDGCTSLAEIRLPTSRSPPARERISSPTRSSCSTPRPATTSMTSRSCRRTGTTGTSPTRPSSFRRRAASSSCRSRPRMGSSTVSISPTTGCSTACR